MRFVSYKLILILLPIIFIITYYQRVDNFYVNNDYQQILINGTEYNIKPYVKVNDSMHKVIVVTYNIPKFSNNLSVGYLIYHNDDYQLLTINEVRNYNNCFECGTDISNLMLKVKNKTFTFDNKKEASYIFYTNLCLIMSICLTIMNIFIFLKELKIIDLFSFKYRKQDKCKG